jgi:hypothetical protein
MAGFPRIEYHTAEQKADMEFLDMLAEGFAKTDHHDVAERVRDIRDQLSTLWATLALNMHMEGKE